MHKTVLNDVRFEYFYNIDICARRNQVFENWKMTNFDDLKNLNSKNTSTASQLFYKMLKMTFKF
jgi:hypothetical protein